MTKKKTMVLGASSNPNRYSYLAIDKLQRYNHPVVAIGRKAVNVLGVDVKTTTDNYDDIDTVTIYLNPQNQKQYYNYILSLKPRRIIFNPGAENDELSQMAEAQGIQPLEACTLVMLSTGQF